MANRLPSTRHSLLLRLADPQDAMAWSEFLDVYEVAIFRYSCSRGLQAVDAEDVTQKVLAAVLAKSKTWNPDNAKGSFGAWLFTVTRNLSAKTWNDRKKTATGSGDSQSKIQFNEIPEPSEKDKTIFHLEYRRALFHWAADRIRDSVKQETWRAFWMTAVEQIDARDVANELGISVSSVYTAKCRILARIRNEINSFEHELSIHEKRELK